MIPGPERYDADVSWPSPGSRCPGRFRGAAGALPGRCRGAAGAGPAPGRAALGAAWALPGRCRGAAGAGPAPGRAALGASGALPGRCRGWPAGAPAVGAPETLRRVGVRLARRGADDRVAGDRPARGGVRPGWIRGGARPAGVFAAADHRPTPIRLSGVAGSRGLAYRCLRWLPSTVRDAWAPSRGSQIPAPTSAVALIGPTPAGACCWIQEICSIATT